MVRHLRDPLYRFMHGSPWEYDTHIPVLLYGAPFVKPGQYSSAGETAGRGADRRRDDWRVSRCRPIRAAC